MNDELSVDRSEDPTFIHSRIDDLGLSLAEFRVYCHLKRRTNHGVAWPGIDSIAAVCRANRTTVIAAIRGLEIRGMLQVTRIDGERNLYHLTNPSLWKEDQSEIGNGSGPVGNRERGESEIGNVRESIQGNPSVPSSPSATSHSSRIPERTENARARAQGSLEELKAFAVKIGQPESDGEYLYHHWEGSGWKRGSQPIKHWEACMRAWKAGGYLPSQKSNGNGNGKKSAMTPEEKEAWSQRRCMLGI